MSKFNLEGLEPGTVVITRTAVNALLEPFSEQVLVIHTCKWTGIHSVKLTGSCVLKVPSVECQYTLINTWLTSWSILGQHLINTCSTASSQSTKCWPTDMYWSTISRLLPECQPRCLSGINWESTEVSMECQLGKLIKHWSRLVMKHIWSPLGRGCIFF